MVSLKTGGSTRIYLKESLLNKPEELEEDN